MSDINIIHEKILSGISDTYEKTVGFPVYDITRAIADIVAEQEDDLLHAIGKMNVDNLSGDELSRFVKQRKGIERKSANAALGILLVTGTGEVSAGDLFESENGVQFKARTSVDILESGEVEIVAAIAGSFGNVGASSIKLMPVSLPGIVSVNNNKPTHDGYDEESDDALRERYYIALRTPATSGNKHHYRQWALEITGVGDAKIYPLAYGDNTVEVIIIDADRLPANEALVARTQEYIDPGISGLGEGAAPVGAYCTVKSADKFGINVAVKLTLSPDAEKVLVETVIKAHIIEYLKQIAFKTNTVSHARLGDAILNVDGVEDYEHLTINDAVGNISVEDKMVAVLETAVFVYA